MALAGWGLWQDMRPAILRNHRFGLAERMALVDTKQTLWIDDQTEK
jgi:hypothetical protein